MRGLSEEGASYHAQKSFSKVNSKACLARRLRLVFPRHVAHGHRSKTAPARRGDNRSNFERLKGVTIGGGRFAGCQAEAWRRVEGAQIVAVADAPPGRAEEFSRQFGIARAYQDAAEML